VSTAFAVLNPFGGIYNRYIYYYLRSKPFIEYVEDAMTGMAYPAINDSKMNIGLIPIPPTNEQKRIVANVDELMALCDELEARKQKVSKNCIQLNDASIHKLLTAREPKKFSKHWQRICDNFDLLYSKPENVNKLRQAILQLAVQGKLVPQDPKDEPLSVLLEQIKAEKERLIKEKKIKKPKPLPPIKPYEFPYKLPVGWKWVRFSDAIVLKHGHQFRKYDFVPEGIPVVKIGQCKEDGSLELSTCDYIDLAREKEFEDFKIYKDDLLMALTGGTLGKVTRVDKDYGVVVQNYRVGKFIPIGGLFNKDFCTIILKSNLFQSLVQTSVNQNAQPNIGKEKIELLLIPCPPLNEQKRIVAKIDELMSLCDQLETRLSQSQTDCDRLMEAAVAEILAA